MRVEQYRSLGSLSLGLSTLDSSVGLFCLLMCVDSAASLSTAGVSISGVPVVVSAVGQICWQFNIRVLPVDISKTYDLGVCALFLTTQQHLDPISYCVG